LIVYVSFVLLQCNSRQGEPAANARASAAAPAAAASAGPADAAAATTAASTHAASALAQVSRAAGSHLGRDRPSQPGGSSGGRTALITRMEVRKKRPRWVKKRPRGSSEPPEPPICFSLAPTCRRRRRPRTPPCTRRRPSSRTRARPCPPGPETAVLAVRHPARPYKSPIET
jgi:hypothetical protein